MILVIGLDGADWRILQPWIEQGLLPHLAALQKRGAWGILRSTLRPESSIAWSTFATGRLPGHHGIFSFSRSQPGSYTYGLNNASHLRAPTFWHWAAESHKRIALLNVPMTFPPRPLPGGGVIAGMLTPSLRSSFTYPPDLAQRLLHAVPDYVINVDHTGLSLDDFIRRTVAAIRSRTRAAQWLLAQDAWDAAVIVYTATDRLQHYTLHLLHPQHPAHQPGEAARLQPLLLKAYQAIDEGIGQLLQAAGPQATVLVLSDHGFAPCSRLFYPNMWLEELGLLRRRPRTTARPSLWQRLRRHRRLRQFKQRLPLLRDWQRSHTPDSYLQTIDWQHTSAFYAPDSGIRLNIRGRETQGTLSPTRADALLAELSDRLLALRDPQTGTAPIIEVYTRQQAYAGPYSHLAPDLILEPRRDDSNPANNTAIGFGFAQATFTDSGDITGNHAFDGILLAAGPDIAARRLAPAHIADLAPTLLHSLRVAPPPTDGQILPLWTHTRPPLPPRQDPPPPDDGPGETTLSADDEQLISERLRSLGYL